MGCSVVNLSPIPSPQHLLFSAAVGAGNKGREGGEMGSPLHGGVVVRVCQTAAALGTLTVSTDAAADSRR